MHALCLMFVVLMVKGAGEKKQKQKQERQRSCLDAMVSQSGAHFSFAI